MATAQQKTNGGGDAAKMKDMPNLSAAIEATMTFVPLGEEDAIDLSVGRARKFLCKPTKSGAMPDEATIVNFLMTCKSRRLNPYVGDCFLTGYDSKDGPQFAIITSYQALSKRAELHPQYDGIESGIIVMTGDGVVERRTGSFRRVDESLVGAWAIVYRKDRTRPIEVSINRKAYDKGFSQWSTNPDWMLLKCANAAAKREAFPTETSGLYISEEMQGDAEVLDRAIEETKQRQAAAAAAPKQSTVKASDLTTAPKPENKAAKATSEFTLEARRCDTIEAVQSYRNERAKSCKDVDDFDMLNLACDKRIKELETAANSPGQNAGTPVVETVGADGQLFETSPNAAEA